MTQIFADRKKTVPLSSGFRPGYLRPSAPIGVIGGNSEFREWPNSIGGCCAGVAINSDLGLRVSFGLRSAGLGLGMARTDFRAALLIRLSVLFCIAVQPPRCNL